MKKRLLFVIMLIGLLVSGCTKIDEVTTMEETSSPMEVEFAQLRAQLESVQAELRASNERNDILNKVLDTIGLAAPDFEKYPELAILSNNPVFERIEFKGEGGTVSITDPKILSSVSYPFYIQEIAGLGSPPMGDVEPVELYLTTDQGSLKAQILKRDMMRFDEIDPYLYYLVDQRFYQLAKAFMNPPSYLSADQSTIMKMIDSGLLKSNQDQYTTGAERIFAMAKAFHNLDKTIIAKPVHLMTVDLSLTFFYYREEIQLNIYENQAQLIDGKNETWYELQEGDSEWMSRVLTAG
ncbi:hypothetical protein [Paenibacillus paeoniae]|uniref:Uncharacterized protein n=1 Tax=Paenibacillus paeoniae TaxID=2292705 RepID=A0A371PL63_9BACL|nr:hypothetical protein [Paenibacillus paeoniae]REK76715.1 hypothetical protein DX130_06660 [Paenibacillus paeoniae]